MYEYVKTILSKVSFDEELFEREYTKAMSQLETKEKEELQKWVSENFTHLNQEAKENIKTSESI